ncbi:MAG: ECF RNA polymerase sigma factor SigR [Verrucomicrobiae bacterium]|nr:ECF RNA polymerase sigma factor SigR [Verrucomicrobiae bacterium]
MDSGKQPSFEEIVESHYRGLYQFALSLTGAEAEAGDLTQQAFFIWAKKGNQLREISKVKSWLFTTLHREFLQSRRRQSRFPHVEIESVANEIPPLPPALVNELDGATVLAKLRQVDDLCQAPLALFYLEDLPYKEIAEILGVPVGTVQSRIARGKAQLAALLQTKEAGRG